MGEAARKYDLFDSDPVDPAAYMSPPVPRRPRPVRRRVQPTRGEPARVEPIPTQPAPAEPGRPRRRRPGADQPRRGDEDRRRRADGPRREARVPQPRADRSARVGASRDAPPAPVAAPRTPFVMLVVILVAAGIVGLLVLNTKINENSYQLQQMRDAQTTLDTKEQNLRSQLAARQSPGNLAAAARRLGLVPAHSPAFLQLPDGRVFSMPGPAKDSTNGR